MKVKTAEKFLKNLKCRETTVLIKYHYAVSCLNPFRDDLALKPVFGHGDLLVLVPSDVGRPENDFLYLCWTDGFADIDVGLLASGCEMSGKCHESCGRPNEFLSHCWTDGRTWRCAASRQRSTVPSSERRRR